MIPEHAVPILAAVLIMGSQPRIATSVVLTGVTTRYRAEPRCAVHDSDVVYRHQRLYDLFEKLRFMLAEVPQGRRIVTHCAEKTRYAPTPTGVT
jgi:hypothetical protein